MGWRWLFAGLLIPFLTACSNAYHPLRGGVGFTELPVGPDTFQVSFSGDSNMTIAESRRMALLRAAEVAALRNLPYFQILSEHIYVSYGTRYWPGTDVGFVEGFPGRHGGGRLFVRHYYEPGYFEPYTLPEVVLQVQLFGAPGPSTIPAAYLLRQALTDKIKLSPGVAERVAGLPEVTVPVTLPPAPVPTTRPAQ